MKRYSKRASERGAFAGHEPDPVFVHSRREAIVIFCLFLAGLLWAVPFCYLTGYPEQFDPSSFPAVWGIPAWLFWGIVLPWLLADAFTIWFCFWYMADDKLSPGGEAEQDVERVAEWQEGRSG